jgi:NADP oxidoreductase coenzyme F420-dependent
MAADDVAGAVGLVATGSPVNGTIEVGGPEKFRFDELVRRGPAAWKDPREVVTDSHARYYGIEVKERALVPEDEAEVGKIRFEDWLRPAMSLRQLRPHDLLLNHRSIAIKSRGMKIGIIGAGQIGETLTRRFAALGRDVSVANSRGPEETLADLARETGAKAVTAPDAATAGERVIVTIPEGKTRNLPKDLFAGVPDDVVVVDTGNYYPRQRDGRIAGIEDGMTESRWVSTNKG